MSVYSRSLVACLWDAQGGRCSICGARMASTRTYLDQGNRDRPTIDHVFPTGVGGPDEKGNILAAHARCNHAKAANWPTEGEQALLARVNAILRWEAPARPELVADPESGVYAREVYGEPTESAA